MKITKVRDIGRLIRARRRQLGWSQTKLAEEAQTTRRWISEIEQGKSTAEIGLVLGTVQALGITFRLESPGSRNEPVPRAGNVVRSRTGLFSPSTADLEAVISRHTEAPVRKKRSIDFLRTKR